MEELVSSDLETPIVESNPKENLGACPSKSQRVQSENPDEIKTSLRLEIVSDLAKILAEDQKEMVNLMAPFAKQTSPSTLR